MTSKYSSPNCISSESSPSFFVLYFRPGEDHKNLDSALVSVQPHMHYTTKLGGTTASAVQKIIQDPLLQKSLLSYQNSALRQVLLPPNERHLAKTPIRHD